MTEQAVIAHPLPELRLEYAFSIRIDFRDRLEFGSGTPRGGRGYVSVAQGKIEGPLLQGKVMPDSGADWALIRESGILEINAHYMLQAADGTPIYMRNRGYMHRRPGGGPPTYFVLTPVFDAPVGLHDWLTRTVFVGKGERRSNPDHSLFSYWAIRT